MTVLSRGARARRGGRRPGWPLLTALLVLAIGASSALVFTNRVELLKLAVILALWAAVVAAFVSVIYRRQSDTDQARARDLKLVYDLQLDREISARREYELTVESQLRRELASELRSQAADEVAALRTELTTLRTNLEILFDADLDHRPALETERATVRAYSDWDHDDDSASASRVDSSRVAATRSDSATSRTDQNPIIDVPEVGVFPPEWEAPAYGPADAYARPDRGSHWQRPDDGGWHQQNAGWPPQQRQEPYSRQARQPEPAAPQQPAAPEPASDWQPVGAEGLWLPPGAPGSNWASASAERREHDAAGQPDEAADAVNGSPGFHDATPTVPSATGRHGRHTGRPEPAAGPPGGTDYQPVEGRRARARRRAESEAYDAEVPSAPTPAAGARHRSADPDADTADSTTGGQSVADLLARLQTGQPTGGRRRRRAE
jgi:hypothetical protein